MIDRLRDNQKVWDLYTAKEEYNPLFLDQYGRFPRFASAAGNVFAPEVSTWLVENGMKPQWPDGAPFAVCLTHDVDVVRASTLRAAYDAALAVRRRQVGQALEAMLGRVWKRYNHAWNFSQIMDIEARHGARSSFYCLALEPGEHDFNFRVNEVQEDLREIVRRGWEVGLHGGHRAYRDLDALRQEKDRIERALGGEVIGYRNHYLRFTVPRTWELLARAGFHYDTTFGYADCVGFRNRMCHPFCPVNRTTGELISIMEIPLTIMDRSLDTYMRIDAEKSWEITERLIKEVERHCGVITILWHNTSFTGAQLEFYERILTECSARKAWMTSGAEVYRWWKRTPWWRDGADA